MRGTRRDRHRLSAGSAYLITELNFSHRRDGEPVPMWYDIVLLLTLALSGVMNTLLSVFFAQTIFALVVFPNHAKPLTEPASWVLAVSVFALVSVGIYLGRYIRFNSWDVLHPRSFIRKLRTHFSRRGALGEALAFCVLHAVLLLVLYLVVLVVFAVGAGLV